MSDGKMSEKALRWQKIEQVLQTHELLLKEQWRCFPAERFSSVYLL